MRSEWQESILPLQVWIKLPLHSCAELIFKETIRHILYDAFVQTHPIGQNEVRTVEEGYAVFGVSKMSLGAFEREQREHIIRHVSDDLLKGISLPDYPQYMALLVRSLDYPKKSMHLVSQTLSQKDNS